MPTTIGFIGKSGSPSIKIRVEGTFAGSGREFEVTVDTGFISMPIMDALPLGLPLYGTTSIQFGDGSVATRYTALGVAHLAEESKAGVVILEPSTSTILVGMDFLTAFEKTVFMHRGVLFIMDQTEVDKTMPPEKMDELKATVAQLEAAQAELAKTSVSPPADPPHTELGHYPEP